ncbi:hypothetical protein KI387_023456 [Taxus chinensis]|uniref:Uncharacterized protein n=1 Tax=Taxus chinensis TaxID=29808 RepID=A0AA38G1Z0_TAXCH|nr:hypothetical protein KI387_023456 [Taxus chinensis]
MQEDLKRKQEQVQSLLESKCILQDHIRQKEHAHIREVQKVRETLKETSARLCAKEQVENEHQNELRRLQETIERTHAIRVASEIKVEEYQHQLQALQQEILAAKHVLILSEEKNKIDKESLLDALNVRDRNIEELKVQIVHFEQSLNRLSQQEETWVQMQSQYKQLSDLRTRELESLSIANAKLESISKQLIDKEQERDLLQNCIESKEADLGKLKKENEILIAERNAIIDSIKVQEGKNKTLIEENRQIKLDLQEACIRLQAADSELISRDTNITKLQEKLKRGDVLQHKLSDAEKKMHCLEGSLEEARSCLQDREDQISEFEVTVEQFRNEVLVTKLQLAEKEKDEALLVGKLRDVDNDLRSKEDRLLEMDSKLNSILRESEEKQAEILCLRDELRRLQETIERTEATCVASEIKAEEYQHQLQALQQEILASKHALSLSEEKNKTDKESLLDAIKNGDRNIKELKDQIVHFEQSLNELSQQEETWVQLQSQHKQLSDLRARELESLSVANANLESISKQLLDKEQERDLLQKCIETKEAGLGKLRKENEILIAEKSAVIDSIKLQEEKYKKLTEENEQIKLDLQEACIKLEVADSELTERDYTITELQEKLKHGDVLHQELSDTVKKMQCLEGLLEEARSCLQDKEDQISEFEVMVEQSKNEVLVARLQLAEKEKDEAILVGKLRDADNDVRSKEDRLLKTDLKLNSILRETEEKQAEILCLRDEIKEIEKRLCESEERHADMEDQMKSVSVIVEEKVAALNAAELEAQRERNALEDKEDVIEQLKIQLSNEEKTCFERQSEIELLYKDLERTKIAERQVLENLKEVQGGLEQLEQDSEGQICKLQGSITELQYELSTTHMMMENIDNALKCANGELSLSNEKCTALEHMLSIKDEALQAKERELSFLQTDISQQAEIIGKGQLHLQLLQDRLQGELESRENLENTVSLFIHQVAELQKCNQELENKLSSINQDYEAAMKTVCDSDAFISCLEENLKVCEGQLEEFNVASRNHEQIISELLQKLNLSEGKLEVLEKQAFGLQGDFEGAVDSLKEETNEVSSLSYLFDELKTQLAEIKMDTISGLKEGMRYVAEFRDVTKVLDNFQLHLYTLQKRENDLASRLVSLEELLEDSKSGSTMQAKQIEFLANTMKDLDSQLLEWKDKAFKLDEAFENVRSELENANQVISNLQRQLDGCKSIQDTAKDIETSIISSINIDVLKRDPENWKTISMSATEETKHSGVKLKLFEDSVPELSSNMEGHENKEHHMERHCFLLEEEIWDSLSGLSDEMDKFSLFCSSTGEQDGEVEKFREEMLLNHIELKAILSSVKDQLKGFESLKGQFQSYDMKLETMKGQLSVLQSDLDKEREKANHYAKSREEAEIDLVIWKNKVEVVDSQNKVLQSEVELLNRSLDELRKQKGEVMGRESQLQVEITAMQESLQNLNSNFVEETGRANSLLVSIKRMEEERNNLLEKMNSITEENKSTKLELEAARMEFSQLSLHVGAGDTFRNMEEINQKLKSELTVANEEIQSRKDFVQKLFCELHNMEVQDISHRVHFQAIQDKILKNWDMEGTLVSYPMEDSINEGYVRDAIDDSKISYASWLPTDKRAQSKDENATGEVEAQHLNEGAIGMKRELSLIDKHTVTPNNVSRPYDDGNHLHVCDICQKIQGEQAEEKVQVLMKELETALVTLAGKNAAIEKLNREVVNMQALVKRLGQRPSQLEQYKDSSTIEPERYIHYVELCDSLVRDQLRLKKKLEIAERKNQVLVDQIEQFWKSTQARTPLEKTKKDRELNEKQDENLLCTPKPRLLTDVGSGHGSAERSPLQVLNC